MQTDVENGIHRRAQLLVGEHQRQLGRLIQISRIDRLLGCIFSPTLKVCPVAVNGAQQPPRFGLDSARPLRLYPMSGNGLAQREHLEFVEIPPADLRFRHPIIGAQLRFEWRRRIESSRRISGARESGNWPDLQIVIRWKGDETLSPYEPARLLQILAGGI